ncbi:hypothetical protein ACFW1P_16225, partial [Paenibacillus sp. NPDC058910]|uniref:hypothetical protein n=1 Tax=Paenibacillus sp. NPDC058910 TaxID=3346670 RepID=UPI0036C598E3
HPLLSSVFLPVNCPFFFAEAFLELADYTYTRPPYQHPFSGHLFTFSLPLSFYELYIRNKTFAILERLGYNKFIGILT